MRAYFFFVPQDRVLFLVSFSPSCFGAAGFLGAPHPQDSCIPPHPLSAAYLLATRVPMHSQSTIFLYIRNVAPRFLPAAGTVRQDIACSRNPLPNRHGLVNSCRILLCYMWNPCQCLHLSRRLTRVTGPSGTVPHVTPGNRRVM